ncbi:MAG: hypothetical protein WAT39_08270 [Planctomycetota bacterium]
MELVVVLSPDLSQWFQWIDGLAPDATEDTRLFAFNTLGELARRGHGGARTFLRRQALEGRNWQDALSQFLVGISLDHDAWSQLLPRVDDETLGLHVDPADPVWARLAGEDVRVARFVREKREVRDRRADAAQWSAANYAAAESSQRRWRVLESLTERDPAAAVPFLIDGLWDGSHLYRDRCIVRCDPNWPGVRERLAELANAPGSKSAAAARRRLNETTP